LVFDYSVRTKFDADEMDLDSPLSGSSLSRHLRGARFQLANSY